MFKVTLNISFSIPPMDKDWYNFNFFRLKTMLIIKLWGLACSLTRVSVNTSKIIWMGQPGLFLIIFCSFQKKITEKTVSVIVIRTRSVGVEAITLTTWPPPRALLIFFLGLYGYIDILHFILCKEGNIRLMFIAVIKLNFASNRHLQKYFEI